VFRQLATQILNRALPAGTALPPERELAARFDVSRIVVREAVHRLKEYELVRVRQGSPTQVLDPNDAKDMRLIGLEIELMPNSADSTRAFRERMVYAGAALLDLAEQRMSDAELDELERLVGECLATAQEPTEIRLLWGQKASFREEDFTGPGSIVGVKWIEIHVGVTYPFTSPKKLSLSRKPRIPRRQKWPC